MTTDINGNNVRIAIDANELTDNVVNITLPDAHYFDKAFEPILVTGDDGNEYNVIPSDQFK